MPACHCALLTEWARSTEVCSSEMKTGLPMKIKHRCCAFPYLKVNTPDCFLLGGRGRAGEEALHKWPCSQPSEKVNRANLLRIRPSELFISHCVT